MSNATYFQRNINGVIHAYMEVNGKTIEIPSYYWEIKQKFDFPKVWLYDNELASSFGDYHFYNIKDYFKDIERINNELCHPKQPIGFGPYIDFEQLRDSKTYSIDDFFVQYKPGDEYFTIWDHNIIDNKPRQINWLDRNDRQQPIIFKPIISLKGIPKTVDVPRSNSQNTQSSVENMVFRLIAKLGFDKYPMNQTPHRFFKLLPEQTGNYSNSVFDSGVLFRFGHDTYGDNYLNFVLIDSAAMQFIIYSIYKDHLMYRSHIKNIKELTKELKNIKMNRDKYLIKTYGLNQKSR